MRNQRFQNIILKRSGVTPFVGILDLYPNAAVAFSLRKLKSDYLGSAIRLRRSGDDAELDVGFTAAGDFDFAAAQSFCIAGGGTQHGYIVTRYDQSGNGNNATQSLKANQVQLVSSGAIFIQNSKPCSFNNNNGTYNIANSFLLQDNYAIFCVAMPTVKDRMLYGSRNVYGQAAFSYYYLASAVSGSSYNVGFRTGSNAYGDATNIPVNVTRLFYATNQADSLKVGYNNTDLITATDTQKFELSVLETGFNNSSFYRFSGYMFEQIAYSTYPNVSGIKANQNNYYGIY